jgi:hypothetical protein
LSSKTRGYCHILAVVVNVGYEALNSGLDKVGNVGGVITVPRFELNSNGVYLLVLSSRPILRDRRMNPAWLLNSVCLVARKGLGVTVGVRVINGLDTLKGGLGYLYWGVEVREII